MFHSEDAEQSDVEHKMINLNKMIKNDENISEHVDILADLKVTR